MTTPTRVRLGLIILAVSDLARAVAFYREALGWATSVEAPVYVELTAEDGFRLGLYERRAFGNNTGRVPHAIPAGALAPTELYLFCDDLPRAIERVTRAGATLLSALQPRSWGDEVAYYADPDGNVLALARVVRPDAGPT